MADQGDDGHLEGSQGLVEAQLAAAVALGSGSRRGAVMNRWAAVTRVTWWCRPTQVRPWKWSSPGRA